MKRRSFLACFGAIILSKSMSPLKESQACDGTLQIGNYEFHLKDDHWICGDIDLQFINVNCKDNIKCCSMGNLSDDFYDVRIPMALDQMYEKDIVAVMNRHKEDFPDKSMHVKCFSNHHGQHGIVASNNFYYVRHEDYSKSKKMPTIV